MGTKSMLAVSVLIAIALYAKSTGASYGRITLSLLASTIGQVVLGLGWYTFIHRWLFASTKDLPHPKSGSYFLGNLVPFMSEPWGFPLAQWQVTIPYTPSGFYRILLGPMDMLVPKTAKAIGTVMNQPYIFPKPTAVRDGLVETLGVGLVSAEGEVHKRQKKLLTPIFGLARNKRLVPQMWDKSLVLYEVMQKSVREAGGSAALSMHNFTMAAALDIIGVTTVGVDFDSLRVPNQPILQAYRAVFPQSDTQTSSKKLLGAVLPALVSPHLLFKLPLRPIRRFHWGMNILTNFCVATIRQKKQEIEESSIDNEDIRQKDILSAIICSGMTDERELVNHLLTILAAGHESTAVTLAWAVFKLAQLPDIQEKIRQEVQSTLPNLNSEAPSYEAINSMQYLRCFTMELFRLYPAFPGLMREASKTTQVEGLSISRGTQIMVSPYAINRNPELWGTDANEFRIERWMESHNGGAKSAQAFMTFSSGQRICIGKDFAALSLKVSLVVLLSKFRFTETVPGFHPTIQKGTALKPMGLKVTVSEL